MLGGQVATRSQALRRPAMASSTAASAKPDARIAAIDADRKSQKLSHAQFCRLANIESSQWFRLRRGEYQPTLRTIERLKSALAGQRVGTSSQQLVKCCFEASLAVLRILIGDDLKLIAACAEKRPRNGAPAKISEGRLRRLATYVVTVELCIENADLARALGVSRQNVKQARDDVEDLRDGSAPVSDLLDRAGALVRGEAEK